MGPIKAVSLSFPIDAVFLYIITSQNFSSNFGLFGSLIGLAISLVLHAKPVRVDFTRYAVMLV
jgi:hypothetical protein